MKFFTIALTGVLLLGAQAVLPVHAGVDVVKIDGEDFAFDAPGSIPSGWTTFDYTNVGDEQHFLLFARIPDSQTFDDYLTDIVRPFSNAWFMLREGEIGVGDVDAELGATLPEWFADVIFSGGTGVIEPGMTTRVTLNLDPGTYAIECYMKTEDGDFHSTEGMIRELEVTEEDSGLAPPEADASLTLTNAGIEVEGDLTAGQRTVAVTAAEWPDFMFGHNLHLAHEPPRDQEKDEILDWLNFMGIEGLIPPAPLEFHGGMNILPPGETGYFTVDLEPGRYMLLSETAPWGWEALVREISVDP